MTSRRDARWIAAATEHERAREALREATSKALPIGRLVTWRHGRHARSGIITIVTLYGCSGQVKVRSLLSEKEFWIHVERIFDDLPAVRA